MIIFVDADACPVKDEVLRVAERHQLPMKLVSNSWMRGDDHPLVERITVATSPDAADDWIAERVTDRDIVITSDIPLAARCVAKGAKVLRPNGKPLDQDSISMAVAMRDLHTHLRETGEITRGPAPYTKQDRSRFLDALETAVQAVKRRVLPQFENKRD
ncbi:MAG: YaiI/YqxD family protein [Rhodospirillaceae bacterium]|nr:YaiI/YqxD family protein [Rhodospirillaceae bacterium]